MVFMDSYIKMGRYPIEFYGCFEGGLCVLLMSSVET